MTITTIVLNDTMIGSIISPGPDQFVTRLTMTKAQWPAWQQECWLPLPPPHGLWASGRFVLRDRAGSGVRMVSVCTQHGGVFQGGNTLMTAGQSFQFNGDLTLECLARGQEWEIDFSDVPVTRADQAA